MADVRFRIDFQLTNSPADLKFTDTTDWGAAGLTASNMRIILWIVDGNGTTIYKNGGWSSNDFNNEDIDRSSVSYKDGLALQLNNDGTPVKGEYTFYCKIKDVSTGTVYSQSKTYDYQYDSPIVSIAQSYSLLSSELTSRDATSYAVESVSPSITRAHAITKPDGAGANDPGSTADESRTIGGGATPATRLWTGDWLTSITSDLSYTMETWDGSGWLVIVDEITDTSSITVTDVDDISTLQTAISALIDRFKTNLNGNLIETTRLNNILLQVLAHIEEYENAYRNGEDYSSYILEIRELLSEEGLYSDSSSTTIHEIVPWGEGFGSSTGNVITFVSETPTGGNSGDMAIGEVGSAVEWNVYYNNGGTWVLKGNLNSMNSPLLYLDVTDNPCAQSTALNHLDTYSMPADTLDEDNDMLIIEAKFRINSASELDVDLRLYLDDTKICEYTMSKSSNGDYILKAYLYRLSQAEQYFEGFVSVLGSPSQEVSVGDGTGTENFTGILPIKASCIKATQGVAGDVTLKYLRVRKN